MTWIVHYDIAALIICLLVLIIFHLHKNFPTIQNKIFYILLIISLSSVVLDLLTVFVNNHIVLPLGCKYFFNILYLIIFNLVPLFYCCLLISFFQYYGNLPYKYYTLLCVPYLISFFAIVTTPATHMVFYISPENGYQHGPLFFLLYAISLFYLLICIILSLKNHSQLTLLQRGSIFCYTISSITVIIVQIYLPQYLLTEFAVSLSMFFILLTLQNPMEFKDNTTSSYNKSAFIKIAEEYIMLEKPFKALAVQTEGLKFISESLGVRACQDILNQVSDFLNSLNSKSRVFHFNDARFVLFFPADKNEDDFISRIIDRFEKPFSLNDTSIFLWSYLCCFSYPENVKKLSDVLDAIDYGLNTAQNQKPNSVIRGAEEILTKQHRENAVENAISKALSNHSFKIFYQPIYSVKEDCFTGAEALLRLSDSELGDIKPDEFIPIAERNGQIIDIGKLVFYEVCRFLKEEKVYLQNNGHFTVHVNLSVLQCMQEDLAKMLISIMDSFGLPYSSINLEITETVAMNSSKNLLTHMEELTQKGIRFSLDDYGTGYSNTINLMQNPYSVIKIDKSLVWAACSSEKALISLRYAISMIQDLNMDVLAEGVENMDHINMLTKLNCDYFQGYYYSRPLPEAEFLELLSKQTP